MNPVDFDPRCSATQRLVADHRCICQRPDGHDGAHECGCLTKHTFDDPMPFRLDIRKWFITKGHPKAGGDWMILPPHRADMPKMRPVRFRTGAEALAAFASGGVE